MSKQSAKRDLMIDLSEFELVVKKAEQESMLLAGKPGGSKAHKKAKYLRKAYNLKQLGLLGFGVGSGEIDINPSYLREINSDFRRFSK